MLKSGQSKFRRMDRHRVALLILSVFIIFVSISFTSSKQEKTVYQKEPLSQWSKQWLEEVVPYIITKAEKEVFLSLPNEIERGKFITLFWKRRDPDPSTPQNEFKDEYYKRIALANQYFSYPGTPGWRTDRGRIFIMLGPPQQIERIFDVPEYSGIHYAAKEIWQYWGLPNKNLPYNFELSFIDKTGTGNFELLRDYLSENTLYALSNTTFQFDSMSNLIEAEKNPFENMEKIKSTVETTVNYNLIPFDITFYIYKNTDGSGYIPTVIDIPIQNLSYILSRDNIRRYSVSIFIETTNSQGQIINQKTLKSTFQETADQNHYSNIQVQTALSLRSGNYYVNTIVLDNCSGKMGQNQKSFSVPSFNPGEIKISDIIFSTKNIDPKKLNNPETNYLIVAKRDLYDGKEMSLTFEVYGLTCSPTDGLNKARIEIQIIRNDEVVLTTEPIQLDPDDRSDLRYQTSLKIRGIKPGDYSLRIIVSDLISNKTATKDIPITINNNQN